MVQTQRVLSSIKCKHITITIAITYILYHIHKSKNSTSNTIEQKPPIKIFKDNPVSKSELKYNVHIFYYAWYRNKRFDGEYQRWHLNETSTVASKFYPALGLYSSHDEKVIQEHMRMIKDAGVGVVVVGWVPPNRKDAPNLEAIMKYAQQNDLKVALQVLAYENRNVESLRLHLYDFFVRYRHHRSLYKVKTLSGEKTMIYIQYSFKILYPEWRKLLYKSGALTVRGGIMDALFIGSLSTFDDHDHIIDSGFDGFYTFSAKNGHTYGSTFSSFRYFKEFAEVHSLIFIPTIGPGHDNTKSNLLSNEQPSDRKGGMYYNNGWFLVLISRAKYVSINSFNDWNEGTQIEPAVPYQGAETNFDGYGDKGESAYLELTNQWIDRLVERWYQRALV